MRIYQNHGQQCLITLTLEDGRLGARSRSSWFLAFFSWPIFSNQNGYSRQKDFLQQMYYTDAIILQIIPKNRIKAALEIWNDGESAWNL